MSEYPTAEEELKTMTKRFWAQVEVTEKYRAALDEIAMQHLREEMDDDTGENAEWEDGYESIVKIARTAISPANRTSSETPIP